MMVLLALGLLGTLAPAFAAVDASGAADCCSPAAACQAGMDACPMQQVCSQTSSLAGADAQTPFFPAVIAEPGWRERILPLPRTAVALPAPPALAGPPTYLRFQRFLL